MDNKANSEIFLRDINIINQRLVFDVKAKILLFQQRVDFQSQFTWCRGSEIALCSVPRNVELRDGATKKLGEQNWGQLGSPKN